MNPWEMSRSGRDMRTVPAGTIGQARWPVERDLATSTGPTEGQERLIVAQAFRLIENCGALESGMDANSVPTRRLLRAVLGQLKLVPPASWPGLRVLFVA
jgi:hypothetical protein